MIHPSNHLHFFIHLFYLFIYLSNNREGMDHYIHRMKQGKKGVGQHRKQDKTKVRVMFLL
jgi:hypothetical protein